MPCPADGGASLGYEIESATPKKKKVIQGINKERPLHAEGSLGLDGPGVLSSNSCHAR